MVIVRHLGWRKARALSTKRAETITTDRAFYLVLSPFFFFFFLFNCSGILGNPEVEYQPRCFKVGTYGCRYGTTPWELQQACYENPQNGIEIVLIDAGWWVIARWLQMVGSCPRPPK